jgi:hypothetical protein
LEGTWSLRRLSTLLLLACFCLTALLDWCTSQVNDWSLLNWIGSIWNYLVWSLIVHLGYRRSSVSTHFSSLSRQAISNSLYIIWYWKVRTGIILIVHSICLTRIVGAIRLDNFDITIVRILERCYTWKSWWLQILFSSGSQVFLSQCIRLNWGSSSSYDVPIFTFIKVFLPYKITLILVIINFPWVLLILLNSWIFRSFIFFNFMNLQWVKFLRFILFIK